MSNQDSDSSTHKTTVWDLPLRVFHWSLALCLVVSFVTVKTDNMEIHITSATCALGLLVFRLLWGFTGSRTSRFSSFIPGIPHVFRYVRSRDDQAYPGHTPLGSLSVVAMLVVFLLQLLTGLVADDEIYITGPLRDYVSSEFSSWATIKHAQIADILLGLVALHIAAIGFYWIVKKKNLILPMITGNTQDPISAQPANTYSKLLASCLIGFSAACAYAVFHLVP